MRNFKDSVLPFIFIIFFLLFLKPLPTCHAMEFKFLLIEDKVATTSRKITYNVSKCLTDAAIDFEVVDQNQFPSLDSEKLKKYRAIIFLAEKACSFAFSQEILPYIENGGTVCVGIHDWNNDWVQTLGVSLADPAELEYLDCKGIESKKPLLKDIQINLNDEMFFATAFNLRFSPEWETMLQYKTPDVTMLARRKYGKGNVVFWNSSALAEKPFRGIFLFSLFRHFPIAAFSVMNVFLMQLDDSPPPAYGIKEGPVYRDLGMTDKQFHLRVWQKNVFPLLEEFKIPVSHSVCLRYGDQITPPFPKKIDREPFFSEFLAEAKKRGHEFSFHGFNHQSLTLGDSPSTPWKSQKDMKESCEIAYKIWQKNRLPHTMVYVPPNNVIDKSGIQAVIEGFPTIRVLCRVYQDAGTYKSQKSGYFLGEQDSNFNSQVMASIFTMYASRKAADRINAENFFAGDEFGRNPDFPGVLSLPRISSGSSLDEFSKLMILNGIMAHGVVEHFFHPDDMYDPSRRENSWEKTLMSLRRMFLFLDKSGSHLRKILTGKYIVEFKKYVDSTTKIFLEDEKQIAIEPGDREYYYLFCDDKIGAPVLKNAEILSEIEAGKIYLIKAKKNANITLQ